MAEGAVRPRGLLTDSFGRRIDYMRVSVTDRCNLRCAYCMPRGFAPIAHGDILRYEEILRACSIAAGLGVSAYKVTGGEPLVSKGCPEFVGRLKATDGVERVTITTNGVLLARHLNEFARMGLDGVTVSVDSLDPTVYRRITGFDELGAALASLREAIDSGIPVKVNCVPMRGVNEGDIIPIAKLAEDSDVCARFIVRMPARGSSGATGLSGGEIMAALSRRYPDLAPDCSRRGSGPAKYYRSSRLIGSIGLIDSIGDCFCAECNRVRLTSEGFLKLCLHRDGGLALKPLLRGGASDGEIESAIITAVRAKPERHGFDGAVNGGAIDSMPKIGG